ncbi:glucarate dehydratase [Pandoraea eparura]|uniref:glucarate dehydratase n=1 Tax=Pandoraea eparura TaxID=2508291 RepID=A0A5E4RYP1_9BURK|nr:glucarate dehydratase family protein [Pandoraea eparura]VVD67564.1 glucarate dehydratase [Pandoraea eparura]
MKIHRITITPIAFRDPPLLNAAGIHEPYALRSILEIETDNGHVGLGETYGDAPVLALLESTRAHLIGMDPFDTNGLRARVAAMVRQGVRGERVEYELAPGTDPRKDAEKIYSAFEVPFLDLQARHLGIPLVELLGGAVRPEVPYSAYLFFKYAQHIDMPATDYPLDPWGETLSAEQLVAQARTMIDAHGFGSIKLKAGVLEPSEEVKCLKALKRAFPDKPLRIDPNGNWSLATAIAMGRDLAGDLEYYEDPTPTLEGMAELHRATGMPLATNMVVTDLRQFRENVRLNGAQIILSDHHYWGGLRDTQLLARMCETFDLGLSMHSNSHLGISLMAMTHLAASVPRLSYACDTHYPWQAPDEEVVRGGKIAIRNGAVAVTQAPGLGLEIDQDQLAKLHEQYLRCGLRTRNDTLQMRKYQPDWSGRAPRFQSP